MKNQELYRGISDKELRGYKKKGIPKGKKFTSDVFVAKKNGKNVIGVNFSFKKFELDKRTSETFKFLKLRERYYKLKKPIKQFRKLMFLD